MENDVVDYLKYLGYSGPLLNPDVLEAACNSGITDSTVRDLVVWLSEQLTKFHQLDSTVAYASSDEDISSFTMEVGSLLKELGCPYKDLSEGPLTERLATKDQCLRLLLFFVSEVMAARMICIDKKVTGPTVRINESSTARELKSIMLSLGLSRPPDNISPKDLFAKVEAKLSETVSKAPVGLCGKPLLKGRLSSDQWSTLKQIHSELNEEYRLRREMLLKRLDVTIQSFEWSEQAKGKENAIALAYTEKRRLMTCEPNVPLHDIIAAREDTAIIDKISSSNARKNTTSSVHKVIIGRVPDRGGRPNEQEAPPPEMPSWQKERAQGGGGGGGGRGGSFNRGGGRVQGGWNDRGGSERGGAGRGGRGGERDDRESRDGGGSDGYKRGGGGRGGWGGGRDEKDSRDGGGYREGRGGYERGGGRGRRGGGGYGDGDRGDYRRSGRGGPHY